MAMPLRYTSMSPKFRDKTISYILCIFSFSFITNNISQYSITRTKFMHLAFYRIHLKFIFPTTITFANSHCRRNGASCHACN